MNKEKITNTHSLLSLQVFIILFITFLMTSPAHSGKPSFNCSKATTEVERTICSNKRTLSNKDYEMAALYNMLYKELDEKNKTALKLEQKEWLKNRDQCINQPNIRLCLAKKYGLRNKELIEKIKNLSHTGNPDIINKRGIYILIKKDYIVRVTKSKLGEEMEKNLNSFGNEPPMVCGCKINTNFSDLSLPDWKPVDIKNYINIIETQYKIRVKGYARLHKTTVDNLWKKYKSDLLERIASNQANAQEAYFDIDNSGDVEHVIRVLLYKCKFGKQSNYITGSHPYLLVIDDEYNSLDVDFKLIFNRNFDAFFYKGETYFTAWDIGWKDYTNDIFYIEKPHNALNTPSAGSIYCIYRYIKFN